MKDPKIVIEFWFEEIEPKLWFRKDADFDALICRCPQGSCCRRARALA